MGICFKNFSFQYDNLKNPTLKHINLEIGTGEKVLIAGPSGSGKSTLAHCLNGLIPYAYKGKMSGELLLDGEPLYGKSLEAISKKVGTILQDADGQFIALSVGEDVAFAFENDSMPVPHMHEKVEEILKNFSMEAFSEQSPQNLSGGQKQKVAMAGVMAMQTDILLFDEPLANLDPMSGQLAMDTIDALHKGTDKTIIVVEHRIEDVLSHHFDRVVLVSKGEIVFNGTPDEVLRSGVLEENGLREPLYIEVLKNCEIDLKEESALTDISTLTKYKDKVTQVLTDLKPTQEKDEHEVLLECKNLQFAYDKERGNILKDISFNVYKGEFLAILGNNGAGKSTLLKALTGFCKLDQGEVRYEGQNITKWSIRKRADVIGYVMQNPNHMITKYMIYDEVAFGLRNFGYSEEEVKVRVTEALEKCGLAPYKKWPVASLSYGQKKRVTIASILALKPKVIVLDEPTAGQDHKNYTEFMNFLMTLKEEGITVIMITHDIQLALEYADRAIVLSSGQILADDTIYHVLSQKEVMKTANLKDTSISTLARLYDVEDESTFLKQVIQKGREH